MDYFSEKLLRVCSSYASDDSAAQHNMHEGFDGGDGGFDGGDGGDFGGGDFGGDF